MKKLTYLLVSLTLLSCSTLNDSGKRYPSSIQTPETVKQLVDWETRSNAVALRSNAEFMIKHYEIPLSFVSHDFAQSLEPKLRDALLFEKNGTTYVRWIINPEDTKWHLQIKDLLEQKGLDTTTYTYLKGYLTASRSMIAVDPHSGHSFSVKVSTNNTGGAWKDKKQTWDDAKQVRNISDWVEGVTKNMKTDTLVIMDEPLAMGIDELDQGLLVRSLNDIPTGQKYYMPGFSALHEKAGREIALLNGEADPVKFWRKYYVEPLANSLAEFSAMTGVYYDSPHSQNFMIELDANKKPTGRVVLRDFGDAYLNKDFVSQTKYADILNIWESDNIISGRFKTAVGLLHGNSAPSWLSQEQYQSYAKTFYKVYENKFSQMTGIPLEQLQQTQVFGQGFSYYGKAYPTSSQTWQDLFKYANCLGGESHTLSGEECLELYNKFKLQTNCTDSVMSFH